MTKGNKKKALMLLLVLVITVVIIETISREMRKKLVQG